MRLPELQNVVAAMWIMLRGPSCSSSFLLIQQRYKFAVVQIDRRRILTEAVDWARRRPLVADSGMESQMLLVTSQSHRGEVGW